MKKILTILFVLCAAIGRAQYPLTQNLASDSTLVRIGATPNGAIRGGLINLSFTDTTAANLSRISFYAGAQIWSTSDSSLYVRQKSATGTFWFKVGGAGGGPTGSFWNLTGNYINVVPANFGLGTNSPDNLPFKTDNTTRLILPSTGIVRSSSAANKYLMMDTTTLEMYYGDGGSGGSAWLLAGNTGTNPATSWVGTNTDEVAASLLFKVGGQYAGYIRRTFSNDSVSPVAPNHGFTTYGQYAGKSILDRVIANPGDSSSLLLNQTLIGYQAGRRIGVILPSDRAGATPSDENLFAGNSVGRMTRVSSGIYGKGRNTIVSSGFGFYRNLSGSYNSGLGQFVLELNNAGNGNSAFGDGGLRSNIDGDFNASFGGSGMLYNSTGVYSVTVVSGGSGYSAGDTVIFSSPLSNGPGTYYATATGRVASVDGGGAITAVTVLTPGGGYVSRGDSCFYVGTCHPAVTATAGGSGTGASLVPVLRSGSYNSGLGISNGANNILSQYMTYFGYNAGNVGTARYWDNHGIAIGDYSGVHTSVDAATAVDNWIALGRNARVMQSNTAALGDSATYPYKWVINGTIGDSALKVNNGLHVTRGVRFSGMPQTISPTLYNFIPKYTSDGTVTNSIATEVLNIVGSGHGFYIDDVTAGVTTTNYHKLLIRNSYDGDGTSNALAQMAQRISGSSTTQKYFLSQQAANIPDGTQLSNYIGKNTSSKNSYLQTFYYAGNGSNGNYIVDQFVGVSNVMRRYASGNVTIGVAADNGFKLEVGGTERVNDSLYLGVGGTTTGTLNMSGSTSGLVTIKPANAAGTYTLTLPTTDGASGEFLQTDGSGVLTWAAAGGGGSPDGNFGNLQINRNGAFATPGSDSLDFESATGLTVKGGIRGTTLGVNGAAPTATYAADIVSDGTYTTNLRLSNAATPTSFLTLNSVYGDVLSIGSLFKGSELLISQSDGIFGISQGANQILRFTANDGTYAGRRFQTKQGADIASANNLTLGGDGNVFEITGTTTINLIANTNWQNGAVIRLVFTSTPTVTNNAGTSGSNINILLAGGANFSATANDVLTLMLCEVGGVQNWLEVSRSVN